MQTTTVVCPCGRKYDPADKTECPELDCAEPRANAQPYEDWYAQEYGAPLRRTRESPAPRVTGVGSFVLGDRS